MRDQYAGDISDLLKFAFLRELARDDRSLGVGWYYNPEHDGGHDGLHREYCDEQKWVSLDAAAWDALKGLPERSVAALEQLAIWPAKTCFSRAPVPAAGMRRVWADDMRRTLRDAHIVFLDPDNGVGPATGQYATIAEVAAMRKHERAVVLIKFPGRQQEHSQQVKEYHNLLHEQAGAISVITVRTCVWLKQPRCRWFTIIDGDDALIERANHFADLLNRIERCSADVVREPSTEKPNDQTRMRPPLALEQVRSQTGNTERTGTTGRACPECGHQFRGNGFDGIDAHWRAKHEAIMPYREAWPLLKAGNYRR